MKFVPLNTLLLLIILLNSCKKDECEGKEIKRLDDFAYQAVPYFRIHKVKFASSTGDTLNLLVNWVYTNQQPGPTYCEGVAEASLRDSATTKLFAEVLMQGSVKSNLVQATFTHDSISGPVVQFLVLPDSSFTSFTSDVGYLFYDHLEINGVSYQRVLQLTYPYVDDKGIKEFYYNADFGILRVETFDGFSLTRF